MINLDSQWAFYDRRDIGPEQKERVTGWIRHPFIFHNSYPKKDEFPEECFIVKKKKKCAVRVFKKKNKKVQCGGFQKKQQIEQWSVVNGESEVRVPMVGGGQVIYRTGPKGHLRRLPRKRFWHLTKSIKWSRPNEATSYFVKCMRYLCNPWGVWCNS